MNAEFCKKLLNACDNAGIDIIDRNEGYTVLSYLNMIFHIEHYMYNGDFYLNGGLTSVCIKGEDYEDFSIMLTYELDDASYETVDTAIDDVIDFVKNCDVKKRMLRAINYIESLLEDSEDSEFIKEYLKYKLN